MTERHAELPVAGVRFQGERAIARFPTGHFGRDACLCLPSGAFTTYGTEFPSLQCFSEKLRPRLDPRRVELAWKDARATSQVRILAREGRERGGEGQAE
jgi:hypothetical protein